MFIIYYESCIYMMNTNSLIIVLFCEPFMGTIVKKRRERQTNCKHKD